MTDQTTNTNSGALVSRQAASPAPSVPARSMKVETTDRRLTVKQLKETIE